MFNNFILQAVTEMIKRMPESKEEMLDIQHVTRANFEKFGAKLLEITEKYSKERKGM